MNLEKHGGGGDERGREIIKGVDSFWSTKDVKKKKARD